MWAWSVREISKCCYRFFTRYDGAASIEINDFGATPGVVALRLAEAIEAAEAAGAAGAQSQGGGK
jgi:malonate decarboxylase delta subunit